MANRLTLKTTPPERLSLDQWPMPSMAGLEDEQKRRFDALKKAVTKYVAGEPITPILDDLGVWREVFYRAYDKCVAPDNQGKPFGWVGLLPHLEVKPRYRRAPLKKRGKSGLAGALSLFLRANTDIAQAVEAYMLGHARLKRTGEACLRHKSVHQEFLRLCEGQDPGRERWPFICSRKGAGAIRDFTRAFVITHYDQLVAAHYGNKAATKAKAGNGHESRLVASMPLDIVEMDEHAMGFIGTVRFETAEGPRFIDAGRMTLLLLADRHKGLILAFKVIYREAPNSEDALDVLHAATVGEPGWAHRKDPQAAARPLVELDARFGWCGFNCLLLDNALIHLADEVATRVMALTGCAVNYGPVRTPARRQLVERIFNALERCGFKRLPTTTGSGPHDPIRQNPEAAARHCVVTETEIVELIAELVRKYNTNVGKHNLAASPLQRMESLIAGEERDRYLFAFLPPLQEGEADLSKSVVTVPIRGKLESGRRPYFSYLEVDYTNAELANDWSLLGGTAVLHVLRSNIRFIEVFVRRRPLGACKAGGRWRWSDHSTDLRREINRLLREGYIENDRNDDVVVAFLRKVAGAAATQKRKPPKSTVRHYGDHRIRREVAAPADGGAVDTAQAAQAVSDLLERASESTESRYATWDDLGAFNGDG